ncbi:MAG: L-lactate dehydrogenase [Candidatus Moraniibacteriota bacterium]|jgi:L-lactate dehydrogenase
MKNKVTIIGAGMVGSTIAHSLVMREIAQEIAIIDINEKLVESQVMDLQHAVPFVGNTDVHTGTYDDCANSDVVVITCGVAQKEGETRLQLVEKNASIMKQILPQIFEKNPNIVLVMVTNPVDVLTKLAIDMFPDKKDQILGTGTLLDSARFRHLIGQKLDINPKSIHAYILGEHGDSEFPVWSTAAIGNMKLGTCTRLNNFDKDEIFEEAKNAAYTIIEGKQSTYYAIGAGASYLINAILHNKKTVLPVSHLVEGVYGVEDVCLSMPAVIGSGGIIGRICVELSEAEQKNLKKSADILKEIYNSIS